MTLARFRVAFPYFLPVLALALLLAVVVPGR